MALIQTITEEERARLDEHFVTQERLETYWTSQIENGDRSAAAHFHLGDAISQQGRLQDAIGYFERAIEIDPSLPQPHFLLGAVYHELGYEDLASQELGTARRLDRSLNVAQRDKQAYEIGGRILEAECAISNMD